jgi:glutamine---fructose-6-phosphate transaminase (isomerizing)
MTSTQMLREIHEQPEVIERLLANADALAQEVAGLARGCRHVLFIARGSSDHAALYGQYVVSTKTGILATSSSPSVMTLYGATMDMSDVLVVAVSQSGETSEIVDAVAWATGCGARTIAITNNEDSRLARHCDVVIPTRAGKELAVPATKTWSSQMTAMLVLAAGLGAESLLKAAADIPAEMARLMDVNVAPMVEALLHSQALMVTSRGFVSATALEVALKLKEACYIAAQGASSADLEHGPLAVVGPEVPVLIVAAHTGPTIPGLIAVAQKAHAAGARVLLLGGSGALADNADIAAAQTHVPEEIAPIVLGVPGQLLTEQLARARGIDPDAPRGLSKVTQTSE